MTPTPNWEAVEDQFDRLVREAFPEASPVDKWGAGIVFKADGSIDVTLKGKTVTVFTSNPQVGGER